MALAQGDIAFTSFNADEDGWSIVTFVDIDPNTSIFFTDNEAIGTTSFNTGESYFQWISGASPIPAGTVIRFTAVDAVTLAASVGTLSRATVSDSTNYGLSASGEAIYAFLGSSAASPTTILTALSTGDVVTPGDPITNAGLTVGVSAIVLRTSADYGEYSGSRAGQPSFASYKASVFDVANWTVDRTDGAYATTVPNTANFTVSSPSPTPPTPPPTSIDLSTYVRIGRYDLPEPTRTATPTNSLLAQEVSAVTYNPDTDTLFVVGDGSTSIVQITKTGQLIDSMTLAPGSSPQGTDFYDLEGLTYVGGGKFLLVEERDRQVSLFTYAPGTTLSKSSVQTVKLGTTIGNIGIEGISYDPQTSGFIAVKETQPEGIFQTGIDFAAGTATNGSPTTTNSTNLFDPALANLLDFADVYALSNLPALSGQADFSHLLVLSQESGKIVNIDRSGKIFSSLTIVSDPGNPLSVADQQHEGLTVDSNGILYVVSENGGGDINRPQLWVYAPSLTPKVNQAPTAVVLNSSISTIAENVNTATPIKVADIAIVDDGLGTNTLTVTGTDANFFEISGSGLFLKAGTVLNNAAKASYSITVNVDDPTIGSTTDASVPFTLAVAVANAAPSLIISEVTPWGSGNSPYAADWFEVTNTGTSAVDITNWKIDDNSNAFASAVALRGLTSIPAEKSAVFIEGLADGSTDATLITSFSTAWFGSAIPPSNVLIGTYGGSGVGLSTAGDAVNLFDASGNRVTGISFGPSTIGSTFDNTAGLGSTTLPLPTVSTLSAIGINGAFLASDGLETGSPGTIASPPTVAVAATDDAAAEAASDPGTFRLTRTGSTASALTVNYTLATGTGQATAADYTPILSGIATIPAGSSFVDIAIAPVDDTVVEGNETVVLTLAAGAGYAISTDNTATITIADNDVAGSTRIHDIQGAAHTSLLNGQKVSNVPGIVTAVATNGFYFQDPNPDADDRTSEGIFVFTSAAPTVAAGDSVLVSGTVTEFRPGNNANNLTITEITSPTISTLSKGNLLPTAVVLGNGGRTIPNQVISNDAANGNVENAATSFDPTEDGIDFYESLEGMRVQINNPVATSPTANFGTSEEIWVLADNGANATNRTARGGSLISASDFNPERIQIDDLINGTTVLPAVNVGAQLSTITGVVNYDFNNYEVLVSAAPTVTQPSTLQKEVTNLTGSAGQLTVATFNVENLDPADGATKFNNLAARIVTNLKSPDIISLEEIQDNNGPTNDSVVDASTTYQTLINAIAAAGGPTYQYRQIDPVDDTNGGEPGGNIRVGFLFNPSRVTFVDRPGGTSTSSTTVTDVGNNGTPDLSASPGLIDPTNAAFTSSRKPLVGEFLFNGQTVYVIGNHFNSKGGDQPLFGPSQPPALSSETQRNQQATIVADFAKSILAIDPKANIVVAGDLNDFEFSNPLNILKAAGLTPLTETLPANERYTYNFQGNAQTLDHLLVSNNLLAKLDGIDVVHINSEFADQDSDHDPSIAQFNLAPKPAPFQLQIFHASDFEAGIPAVDDAVGFSAVINRLRTDPNLSSSVLANTITLSSGDNYIPGAFLNASSDTSLNGIGGLGSSTAPVIGRGDIGILNALGIQASAFGNHEFDLGVRQVRDILRTGSGNPGTNFPYLSTNLNFQPEIAPANPNGNLAASDLATNQTTAEANTIKGKIAKSTLITVAGVDGIAGNADDQKIGIVGATTPTLPNISSIGSIGVTPSNPIDYAALAAEIQSTVDILKAQGINKIILLTHMQQLNIERDELAPRLKDVDIIIGGGSNTLLSDANDVLRAGDTKQGDYPIVKTAADGKPVLVVNTDGNYKYVGRLITEFDDAGVLNVSKLDSSINGAYATDGAGVDRVYGADVDPRAVANPNVVAITDGIKNVIATKDNSIVGKSSVFLNGEREDVRTEETNLGNVTADANLYLAKQIDPTVTISLKNGGGIRDNIGTISAAPGAVNPDDIVKLPTQPNPLAPNKKTGDISQLDIENSLRFNNDLSLITLTAQQLEWVMEHAVAGTRPGSTPGQFPQVSGLKFSFDPTKTAIAFNNTTGEVTTQGDRIRNLAVLNDDGSIRDIVVKDGVLVGDPNRTFRMVTLNFLAGTSNTNILGGDNYPFPKFVKDNAALANRVDLRGETIDLNGNGKVDPALALAPGKFTFAAAGSEQDAFAEYLGDRFSTTPYSVADVGPALDDRIQRLDVRQDTVLVGPPVVDNTPTLIPVGTPGDDTLIASPGALFNGQNDIVFTGAGNDTVDLATVSASPAAGNNRINTGSGRDTIFANKNDRLFGGDGPDIFDATDGQGGNRMSGGAGDDIFFLGKGDRALGGDGNDRFYVQTGGNNLLSGGAGNDQFWIVNAELPSSANTILDFQIGTDVIGISGAAGLGISATTLKLSQVGADTSILFGSQTLATLSGIQSTDLSLNNPNQFVFA
jgi:predicted extracellular nuclease/uncharacterized protein YjiK/2',3'-cyclic-nucleotide 2'-phosphodiesterase (5'-nucleotidase family)